MKNKLTKKNRNKSKRHLKKNPTVRGGSILASADQTYDIMENTLEQVKNEFENIKTKENKIEKLHTSLKEKITTIYGPSGTKEAIEEVLKKIQKENIDEQVETYITLSMEIRFQEEKLIPNFPDDDYRQMYNYDEIFDLKHKIEEIFDV